MLIYIYLFFKKYRPRIKGFLFKAFFLSKKLKVGNSFKCDSFPDVNITDNAQVVIGNNVYFKREVELRAHGDSRIRIGDAVKIDRGVRLLSANQAYIDIRKGVRIGLYSVFNGGDSILVNENSLISGFVYLQTSMHKYKKSDAIKNQGYEHGEIRLGTDVWLGAHSVILPGITLGNGAIVGSNSVVTRDIDENTIVGGVPAKKIKQRFNS